MSYYNECPICGAGLDPGEACECAGEIKKSHICANRHETRRLHGVITKKLHIYYTTKFRKLQEVISWLST